MDPKRNSKLKLTAACIFIPFYHLYLHKQVKEGYMIQRDTFLRTYRFSEFYHVTKYIRTRLQHFTPGSKNEKLEHLRHLLKKFVASLKNSPFIVNSPKIILLLTDSIIKIPKIFLNFESKLC